MPNIARCASALARVILFAAGFAIIATTADAVPAISPTAPQDGARESRSAGEGAEERGNSTHRMHAREQDHRSVLIAALMGGATGTGGRPKPRPSPR